MKQFNQITLLLVADDLLKRPTERREVAQSKKQDSTRDYGRREAVSSDPLQGLHE